MDRLGIDYYGDLLGLLGAAGLPIPLVPAATRAEMVADMMKTLEAAGALPKNRRRVPGAAKR